MRLSLKQLWIRKHLWACYGFNQHVYRDSSLVQNCYFRYCFHFQKDPSSFSPLGLHLYSFLCLEYTLPSFTPSLHLVNSFSGLSFRSTLGCLPWPPGRKWLTFIWIPIAPSSYAHHNPSILSVIVNVRSCLLVCFSTVFSFRAETVSASSLGPPLMEFVVLVAEYLGYWYWTEGLGYWALRKGCPQQGLRHMGS